MEEWMQDWIEGRKDDQMNGRMSGRKKGWINGQMDGWMFFIYSYAPMAPKGKLGQHLSQWSFPNLSSICDPLLPSNSYSFIFIFVILQLFVNNFSLFISLCPTLFLIEISPLYSSHLLHPDRRGSFLQPQKGSSPGSRIPRTLWKSWEEDGLKA